VLARRGGRRQRQRRQLLLHRRSRPGRDFLPRFQQHGRPGRALHQHRRLDAAGQRHRPRQGLLDRPGHHRLADRPGGRRQPGRCHLAVGHGHGRGIGSDGQQPGRQRRRHGGRRRQRRQRDQWFSPEPDRRRADPGPAGRLPSAGQRLRPLAGAGRGQGSGQGSAAGRDRGGGDRRQRRPPVGHGDAERRGDRRRLRGGGPGGGHPGRSGDGGDGRAQWRDTGFRPAGGDLGRWRADLPPLGPDRE